MNNTIRSEVVKRTQRPWGWYESVSSVSSQIEGIKLKRIGVLPGQQISLQKHQHRREHWVVLQGVARVTLEDEIFDLKPGQHCDIAIGQVHRLTNLTSAMVEILEVQMGEYLSEDDIIRLQDDYGRIL